jgi:DNA-binding transcriptional regulator YdaS (Cro superfamily)
MRVSDVVKFFGNKAKVAEAIGVTPGAVTNWGDIVPSTSILQIEQASGGKIKADPAVYKARAAKISRRRSVSAKRRHRSKAN